MKRAGQRGDFRVMVSWETRSATSRERDWVWVRRILPPCNHSSLLIKMGAGRQFWKGPKLNFIGSTVVAGPKQAQGQWMAIKVVLNFIDTAI